MAAAASGDSSDGVVSCVYCLEVEPYLVDRRMLPCGHIFCSSCLSKDAKTNQIIKCPNCRYDNLWLTDFCCSLTFLYFAAVLIKIVFVVLLLFRTSVCPIVFCLCFVVHVKVVFSILMHR